MWLCWKAGGGGGVSLMAIRVSAAVSSNGG